MSEREFLETGVLIVGVRTEDKGVDRNGQPKSNFEPGYDLRAKVTVLAEGPRGSLARQLIERKSLDQGRNPQSCAGSINKLWAIPP